MIQPLKPNWEVFLAEIENFPNVRRAAKRAELHFASVYRKAKLEPEFAARLQESWAIGMGRARDIAVSRAVLGYDEPVIYKGKYQWYVDPKTKQKKLVTVRKFPERLLMKVLSGEIPEVYNRNRMEITGAHEGPVKIEVEFVAPKSK